MGTRIEIDDPVSADVCACFPTPNETPYKILMYFWGMAKCPAGIQPPNGRLFTLFQNDGDPCQWDSDCAGSGWIIRLNYLCGQNQTEIYLSDLTPENYFHGLRNGFPNEHTVFPNQIIHCGFNQLATDGFCTFFWLEAAVHLLSNMRLPNDGYTFMEFFMKDDIDPVYKFCNTIWGLNQKFLVNP